MNKINILVIGNGGDAHAIVWKLKQSSQCGDIYVAPGNPGTAMLGCHNISLAPIRENFSTLGDLACRLRIGLAVIGSDKALDGDIVRVFKNRNIPTFGPDSFPIESRKYARLLMKNVGIPTVDSEIFSDITGALDYVLSKLGKVAIKAGNLATGKVVHVCANTEESEKALQAFMVKKILGSGNVEVEIEDIVEGIKVSVHALSDGVNVKLFPLVRDYEHLCDGDKGPVTEGMGAYGPVDSEPGLMERIEKEIILPCIRELKNRRESFVGCLRAELLLTKDGPKALGFSGRFGDPHAQVYMCLLEDDMDLVEVFLACARGELDKVNLRWKKKKCLCVTLAAAGYPDKSEKGALVNLRSFSEQDPRHACGTVIFHAGTTWSNGSLYVNSGRVLHIAQLVDNDRGFSKAYAPIQTGTVYFKGMQYRKDIGKV